MSIPNSIYQNNLNKSLSLDELADVAHFSPYYFHRIFVAVVDQHR